MKINELLMTSDQIQDVRRKLLEGKHEDYAGVDALKAFKELHVLCKTLDIDVRKGPTQVALFLTCMKLQRWCNLLSQNKVPHFEAVEDTVCDFHNYIDLAFANSLEEGDNNDRS